MTGPIGHVGWAQRARSAHEPWARPASIEFEIYENITYAIQTLQCILM